MRVWQILNKATDRLHEEPKGDTGRCPWCSPKEDPTSWDFCGGVCVSGAIRYCAPSDAAAERAMIKLAQHLPERYQDKRIKWRRAGS